MCWTSLLMGLAPLLLLCLPAPAQQSGNAASPAVSAVRILSPKPGAKITTNFIDVKYELVSAASAASSPTLQLRLDDRDPIHTTDQQQTFIGLQAGKHVVSVDVVDANNTPVPGTRSEVQFTVVTATKRETTPSPGMLTAGFPAPRLQMADFVETESRRVQPKASRQLPQTALPLLSVIAIGVLIGGVISARRTRPRRSNPQR